MKDQWLLHIGKSHWLLNDIICSIMLQYIGQEAGDTFPSAPGSVRSNLALVCVCVCVFVKSTTDMSSLFLLMI